MAIMAMTEVSSSTSTATSATSALSSRLRAFRLLVVAVAVLALVCCVGSVHGDQTNTPAEYTIALVTPGSSVTYIPPYYAQYAQLYLLELDRLGLLPNNASVRFLGAQGVTSNGDPLGTPFGDQCTSNGGYLATRDMLIAANTSSAETMDPSNLVAGIAFACVDPLTSGSLAFESMEIPFITPSARSWVLSTTTAGFSNQMAPSHIAEAHAILTVLSDLKFDQNTCIAYSDNAEDLSLLKLMQSMASTTAFPSRQVPDSLTDATPALEEMSALISTSTCKAIVVLAFKNALVKILSALDLLGWLTGADGGHLVILKAYAVTTVVKSWSSPLWAPLYNLTIGAIGVQFSYDSAKLQQDDTLYAVHYGGTALETSVPAAQRDLDRGMWSDAGRLLAQALLTYATLYNGTNPSNPPISFASVLRSVQVAGGGATGTTLTLDPGTGLRVDSPFVILNNRDGTSFTTAGMISSVNSTSVNWTLSPFDGEVIFTGGTTILPVDKVVRYSFGADVPWDYDSNQQTTQLFGVLVAIAGATLHLMLYEQARRAWNRPTTSGGGGGGNDAKSKAATAEGAATTTQNPCGCSCGWLRSYMDRMRAQQQTANQRAALYGSAGMVDAEGRRFWRGSWALSTAIVTSIGQWAFALMMLSVVRPDNGEWRVHIGWAIGSLFLSFPLVCLSVFAATVPSHGSSSGVDIMGDTTTSSGGGSGGTRTSQARASQARASQARTSEPATGNGGGSGAAASKYMAAHESGKKTPATAASSAVVLPPQTAITVTVAAGNGGGNGSAQPPSPLARHSWQAAPTTPTTPTSPKSPTQAISTPTAHTVDSSPAMRSIHIRAAGKSEAMDNKTEYKTGRRFEGEDEDPDDLHLQSLQQQEDEETTQAHHLRVRTTVDGVVAAGAATPVFAQQQQQQQQNSTTSSASKKSRCHFIPKRRLVSALVCAVLQTLGFLVVWLLLYRKALVNPSVGAISWEGPVIGATFLLCFDVAIGWYLFIYAKPGSVGRFAAAPVMAIGWIAFFYVATAPSAYREVLVSDDGYSALAVLDGDKAHYASVSPFVLGVLGVFIVVGLLALIANMSSLRMTLASISHTLWTSGQFIKTLEANVIKHAILLQDKTDETETMRAGMRAMLAIQGATNIDELLELQEVKYYFELLEEKQRQMEKQQQGSADSGGGAVVAATAAAADTDRSMGLNSSSLANKVSRVNVPIAESLATPSTAADAWIAIRKCVQNPVAVAYMLKYTGTKASQDAMLVACISNAFLALLQNPKGVVTAPTTATATAAASSSSPQPSSSSSLSHLRLPTRTLWTSDFWTSDRIRDYIMKHILNPASPLRANLSDAEANKVRASSTLEAVKQIRAEMEKLITNNKNLPFWNAATEGQLEFERRLVKVAAL